MHRVRQRVRSKVVHSHPSTEPKSKKAKDKRAATYHIILHLRITPTNTSQEISLLDDQHTKTVRSISQHQVDNDLQVLPTAFVCVCMCICSCVWVRGCVGGNVCAPATILNHTPLWFQSPQWYIPLMYEYKAHSSKNRLEQQFYTPSVI